MTCSTRVLPTKLPLAQFYEELVKTQQVLNQKHLGFAALKDTFVMAAGFLAKGPNELRENAVEILERVQRKTAVCGSSSRDQVSDHAAVGGTRWVAWTRRFYIFTNPSPRMLRNCGAVQAKPHSFFAVKLALHSYFLATLPKFHAILILAVSLKRRSEPPKGVYRKHAEAAAHRFAAVIALSSRTYS